MAAYFLKYPWDGEREQGGAGSRWQRPSNSYPQHCLFLRNVYFRNTPGMGNADKREQEVDGRNFPTVARGSAYF